MSASILDYFDGATPTRKIVCDDGIARPEASFAELANEDTDWLLNYRAVPAVNCPAGEWLQCDGFYLPGGLPIEREALWRTS